MRIFKSGLIGALLLAGLYGCFRTDQSVKSDEPPKVSTWFNIDTVDDLYQFLTYDEGSVPMVSAHRGGFQKGYPENCLTSMGEIVRLMPAILEIDVSMTKDSVLVLMHDETLNRTSTGKGKLANKTFQELQQYKLKDNQGNITEYVIPKLEDVLTWGKRRAIFTLDIKRNVPYERVLEVIRSINAEPYSIIITYTANQAAAISRLAPDLMISATIKNQDDLTRLSDLGIPDNRLIAFVGTTEPQPELYQLLRQHGIKSILGTIGNLDKAADKAGYQRYAEFLDRGADILTTDRPLEAWKAMDFYIKKRNLKSPYIL